MTAAQFRFPPMRRRDVLLSLGAAGAAAALPRRLAAQTPQLTMWWWGEQELPGLQAFVADSIAAYDAAQVTSMLQDTAVVISQFQTAAAAGTPPDIQYLWNGIYHMESVWFGYVRALNGLMDEGILRDSNPTVLSNYRGNTYRMGWYPLPMFILYNKDLFDRAGLDADAPPATWDAFLAACDKLKSAGIAPFGGGAQDGYWAEWYLTHAFAQTIDTVGEAVELFIGDKDFRDPRYHEHWTRLQELRELGFLNDEIASIELYPGIDLVPAGRLAMAMSIGTRLLADANATGGRVGAMVLPVFGKGALAGRPVVDMQGLGIAEGSANPEAAARFLEFLNSPERLQAFYRLTGWLPASKRFDESLIENAAVAAMWRAWNIDGQITNITNLMPGQFYEQAAIPTGQQVAQGSMTGEQAGELAARVAQEWRDFNPDLVERYQEWVKDLSV